MTPALWATAVVLDSTFALLAGTSLAPTQSGGTSIARRAAATACAAAVVDLLLRSREMADAPWSAVPALLPTVLLGSRIGHWWLVETVAIVVAWMAVGRQRWVAIAALVCFAWGRSAVSHAAADGAAWPVVVQVLHVLAMGAWTGSVWRAASDAWWPPDRVARCTAAQRLSTLATWALATVVVTGVVSAQRHLGNVAALTADDAYAGWLRIKLACVVLAVALGAVNRWHTLTPLLAGWRDDDPQVSRWERRFRSVLKIESLALLAVIVAAAKLAATEPPGGGR